MTNEQRAARIIETCRKYGSDATNFRDAVHEAHHALDAGVKPGKWDRESIHKKLIGVPYKTKSNDWGEYRVRTNRAELLRYEVEARAVEQLVCRALKIDIEDVEHWAWYAVIEMQKGCGFSLPLERFAQIVERRMRSSDKTKSYVERVLALGD